MVNSKKQNFPLCLKGRMYVSATQAFPLYYFVLTFIVYFSTHWSHIHIGVAMACLSFIPACFIPESPRWLAQNNRHEEAFEVMICFVHIWANDFSPFRSWGVSSNLGSDSRDFLPFGVIVNLIGFHFGINPGRITSKIQMSLVKAFFCYLANATWWYLTESVSISTFMSSSSCPIDWLSFSTGPDS